MRVVQVLLICFIVFTFTGIIAYVPASQEIIENKEDVEIIKYEAENMILNEDILLKSIVLSEITVDNDNLEFIKETEITEVKSDYTPEELDMVACAIYSEGGADYISDDTRLKIGCVLLNRVEHKAYPDSLYEVLTEYKQYGRFYWTGIVWPERASKPEEAHAVQRAYEIAERVLNGERVLDENYVYQAEFKQSDDYIYQDGIYFCKYVE